MNQNQKEFEEIVSRMCRELADFPIDKLDWNKRIAPYLREFQELLAQQRNELIKEIVEIINKELIFSLYGISNEVKERMLHEITQAIKKVGEKKI